MAATKGLKEAVEALRLPGERLQDFMVQWRDLSEQDKQELCELARHC